MIHSKDIAAAAQCSQGLKMSAWVFLLRWLRVTLQDAHETEEAEFVFCLPDIVHRDEVALDLYIGSFVQWAYVQSMASLWAKFTSFVWTTINQPS